MSDQNREKRYTWVEKKPIEQHLEQNDFLIQEKDKDFFTSKKDGALLPEEEQRNPDSLEEARKKVEKQMPQGFEFVNRGKMLENGEYLYKDGKSSKKAKRKVKDNSSMKAVVDSLKALDILLAKELDLKDKKSLRNAFLDVCLACETYINKKNPYTAEGKARKQMVKDFHEQVSWESMRFEQILEGYKGHEEALAGRQWMDVLQDVRVETYEPGVDGVKIEMGGAGTSDVFVIEKNGEKKYFKESEQIPEQEYGNLILNKIDALKKEKITGDTEEERQKNQQTHDRRKILIDAILRALNLNFLGIDELSKEFTACTDKNKMRALIKRIHPLNFVEEDKGEVYNPTEQERIDDFDYAAEFYFSIRKNHMLAAIAVDNAKIGHKESLTKRNAAAARLANILGISDVIVRSKMVDLIVGGKKRRGVLMDEAKGESVPVYEKELSNHSPSSKMRYSPKVLKQLTSLQILDLICGQVDRHGNNYLGEIEEKADGTHEVKGITGIDNDLAFGRLKYKTIFGYGKNGYNRIKNIEANGELLIPGVDKVLAHKIISLKPEVINYQMCDLLNKEEREALVDRLTGVQKALKRCLKKEKEMNVKSENSKFVSGDEGWENRRKQLETLVEKASPKCQVIAKFSYLKPSLLGDMGAQNPEYLANINLKK